MLENEEKIDIDILINRILELADSENVSPIFLGVVLTLQVLAFKKLT